MLHGLMERFAEEETYSDDEYAPPKKKAPTQRAGTNETRSRNVSGSGSREMSDNGEEDDQEDDKVAGSSINDAWDDGEMARMEKKAKTMEDRPKLSQSDVDAYMKQRTTIQN